MARTTINSLGIPADTIVSADLDYPLTDFSSTGIDDNATSTAITIDSSNNANIVGDLYVDTNTLVVDATNNRVGIGEVSPAATLDIKSSSGLIRNRSTSGSAIIRNQSSTGNYTLFETDNNGQLDIKRNTTTHLTIDSSGNIAVTGTVDGRDLAADGTKLDGIAASATNYGDSDVATYISGNRTYGNITTTGYIAGPSTFTIDPAAVGDNTGTLVIAGNLQVDGTTTTINSTTMTVDDLNITLASGAANAAAANGAGITVDGASATLTYNGTNDAWSFNKNVGIGTDDPNTYSLGVGRIVTSYSNSGNLYGLFTAVGSGTGGGEIDFGNQTVRHAAIASLNGSDLSFYTNPNDSGTTVTKRMTIDSSGNVGIGESAPQKKLSVIGGILAATSTGSTSGITIDSTATSGYVSTITHTDTGMEFDTGAITRNFEFDASGTNLWTLYTNTGNINQNYGSYRFAAATSGSDTGSQFQLWGSNGGPGYLAAYQLNFNTGGNNSRTTSMHIDNNGHVGIGTNSPYDSAWGVNAKQLAISGTDYGVLHLIDTGGPTRYSIGAGDGTLYLAWDDVAGAHRIVVDNSGNVGIGETNPEATLHVGGEIISGAAASTSGQVILKSEYLSSSNDFVNILGTQRSNSSWVIGYAVKPSPTTSGVFLSTADNSNFKRGALLIDDELVFMNAGAQTTAVDSAVTLTERMRIDADGKVGIGTTNSTDGQLHVKGTTNRTVKIDPTFSSGTWTSLAFARNGTDLWRTFQNSSDQYLSFYNDQSSLYQLTLRNTGYVGINQLNPFSPLHIEKITETVNYTATNFNSQPTITLVHSNTNGQYNGTRYTNTAGNYEWFTGTVQTGVNYADFVFQGYNRYTSAYQEHVRITEKGRIGIGDANPETPLHIKLTNKLGSTFTGSTRGEGITVEQTNYSSGNYISLIEAPASGGSPNLRIGAKFSGSGSSIVMGTSNNYASGITNQSFEMDPSGFTVLGNTSNGAVTQLYVHAQQSNYGPITARTGNYATMWSILPWSTGNTYISSGIYYANNSWVHASATTSNCLFDINPTSGIRWYCSNDSSGSWNVASNIQLFNNSGQLTASSASDSRLKENIADYSIATALQKVNALRPVSFEWNETIKAKKGSEYEEGTHVGFIAQEVETVYPEACLISDIDDYDEEAPFDMDPDATYYGEIRGVRAEKMVPILVGAIKELTRRLELLENA